LLEFETLRARCEVCANDRGVDSPGCDIRGAEGLIECPPPPPENPPPPRPASTEELNAMSELRARAVAEIALMVRMGYPPLLCAMQLCPPNRWPHVETTADAGWANHDTRRAATMIADVIGAWD
jgi:hypothetical protein